MEYDRSDWSSVGGKYLEKMSSSCLNLLSNYLFVQLNVIIFTLVLRTSIQMKDAVSDFGNLKTLLCLSILLLPLLGCNWILALFTVNEYLDGLFASSAYYLISIATSIYVFVGYCVVNRIVRLNLKHTWCRLIGKSVPVEESLSVTRMTLASRNGHSFTSPFEIHRSPRSFGVTTSSTTSRSTTTKTSSGHHHHEAKRSRKHRRHRKRFKPSSVSESNPSLSLASSHSSDQDEGNSVAPTQNEINSVIQQSLNVTGTPPAEHQQQEQHEEPPHADVTANPGSQGHAIAHYGIIGPKIINHESRPYTRCNILAMGLGGSPPEASASSGGGESVYVRRRILLEETTEQATEGAATTVTTNSEQQTLTSQYLLSPCDASSIPREEKSDNDHEVKNQEEDGTLDQDPGEQ